MLKKTLKDQIVDYQSPPIRNEKKGIGTGRAAMAFSLFAIPSGFISFILVFPMIVIALILGVLSIYLSRGRTICGWIGFIVSTLLISECVWVAVAGR
jgi:hypothetical protein